MPKTFIIHIRLWVSFFRDTVYICIHKRLLCLLAMFSLYGVEICPLYNSQTESLQSAVNGSCMKIFDTKSKNVVRHV